ncbi:MAG TPA: PilW family protein [Candidatus Deferrimicrobium sp.]
MRRNGTAGFSLIELMAAIVILGIAMTAVFSTFLFQQQSYTTQVRVAEMQQNVRDAAEMISRDIRMCTYGIPSNVHIGGNDNEITSRYLTHVNSTSKPDEIYILYRYDGDAAYPPFDNVNLAAGANTVTLTSAAGFAAGDRVIVYDASNADLFLVTAVSGATLTLRGAAGATYSGASVPPARLARVRYVRYFIDNTTDSAHPTLMLDKRNGKPAQPLADDIEDLQFQYNMDMNNNGVISVPDGDLVDNNVAGTPQLVRQVHVYLLARSRIREKGWVETGNRNMADHLSGVANDGYRRRRTEMVLDVRNSSF